MSPSGWRLPELEGVDHVQGTINGFGERCGNANLVSIIPTLMLKMGYDLGVTEESLRRLTRLSRREVLKLAPQQTFRFKANAYGCLSKDSFDAAYQHDQAGEQGKVQEFFSGYKCLSTPEGAEFRVLRVVGHDVEFGNTGNHDSAGLWTADKFIRQ